MTDQLRPSSSSSSSSSPASPSASINAAPSLCSNQCGFYGNPKQDGMCSKCFKTIALKKAAEAAATSDVSPSSALAAGPAPSASFTPSAVSSADPVTEDIPIFRSSISASSLPPLSFSDSMTIPLTSPEASPQLHAAPAPSPQPSTAAVDLYSSSCSTSSSSLSPPLSSLSLATLSPSPAPLVLPAPTPVAATVLASAPAAAAAPASDKKRKNRCLQCNIKVGLTYFSCRCNEAAMFCSSHRYPHSHGCTIDQKMQQQDKLTKANPVCAHDKLERI